MLRKILVPVDFSETSIAALELARTLARSADAELIVLHALELPVMPMGDVPYFSLNLFDELERSQRQRLTDLVEKMRAESLNARGIFHVGMASATILECVRSERPELIVIGSHGRQGLSRLFLGSVAERIVRASPVPVLTIRATTTHVPPAEPQLA